MRWNNSAALLFGSLILAHVKSIFEGDRLTCVSCGYIRVIDHQFLSALAAKYQHRKYPSTVGFQLKIDLLICSDCGAKDVVVGFDQNSRGLAEGLADGTNSSKNITLTNAEGSMRTIRQEKVDSATLRIVATRNGLAGRVNFLDGQSKVVYHDDEESLWAILLEETSNRSTSLDRWNGILSHLKMRDRLDLSSSRRSSYGVSDLERAKNLLKDHLPMGKITSAARTGQTVLAALRATNIFVGREQKLIEILLEGTHSEQFIRGSAILAEGRIAEGLSLIRDASKPQHLISWKIATCLSALWNSEQCILLDLPVVGAFATKVGHPFTNDYNPELNPITYWSALDLFEEAKRKLAQRGSLSNFDIYRLMGIVT